jgi:hypothetical protein
MAHSAQILVLHLAREIGDEILPFAFDRWPGLRRVYQV